MRSTEERREKIMKKISHETKKTIPWDETAHTVRWMPEFVWIITGISSNFSFSFLLLLLYKEYIRKKNALFLVHSFSFCKFWKSGSYNIIFNNYAFYYFYNL